MRYLANTHFLQGLSFSNKLKRVLLKLLAMLLCFQAPNAFSSKPNFRFEHIENEQLDLIGGHWDSVQDQTGFMWFSGASGLARYDGYDVKIYRHTDNDPSSLTSSIVHALEVDKHNQLWVATAAGVDLYDRKKDTFIHFRKDENSPGSISHNEVTDVLASSNGDIWFAGRDGILNRKRNQSDEFEYYSYLSQFPSLTGEPAIRRLCEDSDGSIWLGTRGNGLFNFSPNTGIFKHYGHNPEIPQSLSHNKINGIFADSKTRLWVATKNGLNLFDRETLTFKRYLHSPTHTGSISANYIRDIEEDATGNLWVATERGGLNLYDPITDQFHHFLKNFEYPNGLSSNTIRSIYKDNNGGLWLGHFPAGVSRLDKYASAFINYYHNPVSSRSLSNNTITSITEDKQGNIWIGSENGVNKINRKTSTVTQYLPSDTEPNKLQTGAALVVKSDSRGALWVGTWGKGISKLNVDSSKFKHYVSNKSDIHSLSGNEIFAVYEDSKKQIWIATNEKIVSRYDNTNDRFVRYDIKLNSDANTTGFKSRGFVEDETGQLILLTDLGLAELDQDKRYFKNYLPHWITSSTENIEKLKRLNQLPLRSGLRDSAGILWFGTRGEGVWKLDHKKQEIQIINDRDGLADNIVNGILEDDDGNLWFATVNGLSYYNPKKSTFKNYYKRHGLAGSSIDRPAAYKLSSGEFAIGSTNGLSIFNPNALYRPEKPPKIALTDIQILNKPVPIEPGRSTLNTAISYAKSLRINYQQSTFTLEFAALDFDLPEDSQYAYMLSGFDANWRYVGHHRRATYTNLDPGKYLFRVKAANSENMWSETDAHIHITVSPPWWLTSWAFGFYTLAFFCLVSLLAYTRGKQKEAEQERRLKRCLEIKVAERTAELEEKHENLKKTQSQLIQAEKMSSLGLLVSGIGHEINNPATYTKLAAGNISREVNKLNTALFEDNINLESLQSKLRHHLKHIDENLESVEYGTTRITKIVSDLRSFSRLDKPIMQQTQIQNGLLSTLKLVQMNFSHIIKFECKIIDCPDVLCIPSELNQVFINLMTNACHAIIERKNKEPNEYQGKLSIIQKIKSNKLRISFKDNGIGMTESIRAKMFDPFYTTKEKEGMGIGLSISYGIIERHQGHLEVQTEYGKGTSIHVYLPLYSICDKTKGGQVNPEILTAE